MSAALLDVDGLDVLYGNIQALFGASLHVDEGEAVALLGANGAGKSTLLRAISGLMAPRAGTVRLAGGDITGKPAEDIVALGVAHAPEGRHCFERMTVLENLQLGAYRRGRGRKSVGDRLTQVLELFPRLRERLGQAAGTMSGGEQQMLAIGRALMAEPRLLLLDEPSMGIAPLLVERIFETIAEIKRAGTTILLVEQNAAYALEVADRAYVLEAGRVALSGPAPELRGDEAIVAAYLGG